MKGIVITLIAGLILASTATARDLPAYYPTDELRRAGEIDAVSLADNQIVINDIPYRFAEDAIVHSVNAYSVSITRLRPGTLVAFRMGNGQAISTFWLLPRNYDVRNRR